MLKDNVIKEPNNSKLSFTGLDRVNIRQTTMVVEGPFDSLFLNNCLAVAQSDLRIPELKKTSQSYLL